MARIGQARIGKAGNMAGKIKARSGAVRKGMDYREAGQGMARRG